MENKNSNVGKELVIDLDIIDKIPYSKEELFDENTIVTFVDYMNRDPKFGKKRTISITGLQLEYVCKKWDDDLINDSMVEIDQFVQELHDNPILMDESPEEIKNYLKTREGTDSAKKNIGIMQEQLCDYINNNTMNKDAELDENGLVMLLDILNTLLGNDEILEEVMQYTLKTFNYNISGDLFK
jgi:hypothetical protein